MRSLDGAQNFDLSSAKHPPFPFHPFLFPPHPIFHLSASLMLRVQFDDEKSSAEEEEEEEEQGRISRLHRSMRESADEKHCR
nr:hypothetical transcript [Hymenolepis microstoma]